jgi:hypothetical protein
VVCGLQRPAVMIGALKNVSAISADCISQPAEGQA